jgi:hypothetical protein
LLIAWAVAATCWAVVGRAAELEDVWESRPYRIHATLAIDAPGDLAEQLASQLPVYLQDRANTSIGVVWRQKTDLATGKFRQQLLENLDAVTAEDVADWPPDEDKRLLLSLRATPWGYHLAAREFDCYVQRWGATIRRTTRQRDALPEVLFQLVRQAVAPLAHVRPDPDHPQQVLLELRGSDLPAAGPDFAWAEPGAVFLPILRRTTRDGLLVAEGARTVPWTFFEVLQSADPPQVSGRIRSASQRPLGIRRGRIEQVAIGLRADPGESTVRLLSRADPDKALVGYQLFAQNVDEQPTRPLGVSDAAGDVTVSAGKSAVQILLVKSGDVLLARLPIVPGAEDRVVVRLPDDGVRLRAAARLAALREDMIDLVARRNIFMARVRQEIEEKNFDQARELLDSLDELPGHTQFSQSLEREATRHRTSDLQVQRRIDQLFSQTRAALGEFLDPRPISELHDQLREAQDLERKSRGAGGKKSS